MRLLTVLFRFHAASTNFRLPPRLSFEQGIKARCMTQCNSLVNQKDDAGCTTRHSQRHSSRTRSERHCSTSRSDCRPRGRRKTPREKCHATLLFYERSKGRSPLRCADSPPCGYAAAEGRKATQDAPPGKPNAIVRVHAASATVRPAAQRAAPEVFAQRSVPPSRMQRVGKSSA